MQKFNYFESNGHHLTEIDGKTLVIDTGSPMSFMLGLDSFTFTADGNTYNLSGGGHGVNAADVTNLVGCKVDGFLGNDILKQNGFTLNREEKSLCFGVAPETEKCPGAEEIDMKLGMMDSYISAEGLALNGKVAGPVILDTGAWIGYVAPEFLDEAPNIGPFEDFNPIVGKITGDSFQLEVTAGQRKAKIQAAPLTGMLGMLGMIGDGIIGITGLFEKSIALDYRHGKIYLN